MKRWWRKVRRRCPGIYAYRTRQHLSSRNEWGYVGKSNRLDLRAGQHAQNAPWHDLVIRRYIIIKLPWWLGWDWVLLPLETLVILLLLPRYNSQKNPRPGKVRPMQQKIQRLERESATAVYRAKLELVRWRRYAITALGWIVIFVGVGGYLWTR